MTRSLLKSHGGEYTVVTIRTLLKYHRVVTPLEHSVQYTVGTSHVVHTTHLSVQYTVGTSHVVHTTHLRSPSHIIFGESRLRIVPTPSAAPLPQEYTRPSRLTATEWAPITC